MAYKYTKGKVLRGDIYNEDDTQGNTFIDWSEDAIGLVAGGELAFTVSGSNNEISSSYNLSASSFYGDGSGLSNITADPAGSDTYVQYNNAGSTGGDSGFVYDGDGMVGLTASSNAFAALGIGISSPGAPLHIYEDNSPTVRIEKAAGTNTYTDYVQGGNGIYMYSRYGDYDGIYKWYGRGGNVTNHYATLNSHGLGIKRDPAANTNLHVSGSDSDTMIHVNSDSNDDIFVVMGDGDVGIGTATPGNALHVYGTTHPQVKIEADDHVQLDLVGTAGSHVMMLFDNSGETKWYVGQDDLPNPTDDGFSITHTTNARPQFYIHTDGNVGIGLGGDNTTPIAPPAKLQVSSSGDGQLFRVDGSTAGNVLFVTGSSRVGIGTTTPTSTFEVSGSQAGNYTQTTGNITFNETHYIVDYTGNGNATFTLPASSGVTGRQYHILSHAQSVEDQLTVTGSGGAFQGVHLEGDSTSVTIDGNTPQSLTVLSTGTNWFILHDGRSQA